MHSEITRSCSERSLSLEQNAWVIKVLRFNFDLSSLNETQTFTGLTGLTSSQPSLSGSRHFFSPCFCMRGPSSCPTSSLCHIIWISPTTVISNSPHQRRRRRKMFPAQSPVAALNPAQEQAGSHCLTRHGCQLTFPIPRTLPRQSFARLHTNTHTTSTPSLPEKSQRGPSSSITSSGYMHAPVSPKPAPSSP
jgi:hypothetical protein